MIVCIILLLVGSFCIYYFSRFRTLSSIQKVTSYEDGYNLYQIDIKYDYDLDQIIDYGITDNQSMIDAIIKEALPLLPVKIKAPDFGCTAFTMTDNQNQVHMGRNYDFKLDTSAMLVYCTPQNGYKSVAFAALDNISANTPDESMKKKLATLTSPFICLDGMNEKGVSIAVLTPAYYTAVSTAKLEQRSFCSAQNPTSFGVKLAYGVVSAGNSQKEKA